MSGVTIVISVERIIEKGSTDEKIKQILNNNSKKVNQ